MATTTLTLTGFLLARIAEDEAVLASASPGLDFNWGDYGISPELLVDAEFFNRFADRRRVLAECEAKRRIVERASRSVVTVSASRPSPFVGLSMSDGRYYADGRDVTDEFNAWHAVDGEPRDPETLKTLAAIYADHPDYREAWRP